MTHQKGTAPALSFWTATERMVPFRTAQVRACTRPPFEAPLCWPPSAGMGTRTSRASWKPMEAERFIGAMAANGQSWMRNEPHHLTRMAEIQAVSPLDALLSFVFLKVVLVTFIPPQ